MPYGFSEMATNADNLIICVSTANYFVFRSALINIIVLNLMSEKTFALPSSFPDGGNKVSAENHEVWSKNKVFTHMIF